MNHNQRQYPLFSACGLNCGLCPRYHTDGKSRCHGCAGADFLTKHPSCGFLSCCQQHGLEFCCQCDEYPCKRYIGADLSDSFITHKNQLKDFNKVKEVGLNAYKNELNKKVEILKNLLDSYNSGQQKSFFCIAVNLLELPDIENVLSQISRETKPGEPLKEKSATAVRLFQNMADGCKISLRLRKKEHAK